MTRQVVAARVTPNGFSQGQILFVNAFDTYFIHSEDDINDRYTFDYIIQHATSMAEAGYYFDSILNEVNFLFH